MTPEETRNKILTDDSFVLSELEKIQVLFRMKRVIRYHHTRTEVLDTESVAEHVYGMLVLVDYFLPLEQEQRNWNYEKIQQMTIYHDVDEILTGDRIGYLKTASDREKEFLAQKKLIELLPKLIQDRVTSFLQEYDESETIESQFVKAIDKVEPLFHLINENGKKICAGTGVTLSQSRSIKDKYVKNFPCIKRFNEVLTKHMLENGYFAPEK